MVASSAMGRRASGALRGLLLALGLVGCDSVGTEVDLTPDAQVDVPADATSVMDDANVPDAPRDSAGPDVASLDARSPHDATSPDDAADAGIRDSAPETTPDASDALAEADSSIHDSGVSMDGGTDAVAPPPEDSAVAEAEASVPPPSDGGIPSPGPGDLVDNSFTSVAPNATPAEATPLGTSAMADLVVWVGANVIGGADAANYFVFESAPDAMLLDFNMCFSGAVTAMTASLWLVQDGAQVLPPVATWTITGTCANSYTAELEPSTTYLFAVEATGGPGSYTA